MSNTTILRLVVDNGKLIDERKKVWVDGLEIIADRVKIRKEIDRLKAIDLTLVTKLEEAEDKLKQLMRGKNNVIRSGEQTKGDKHFR